MVILSSGCEEKLPSVDGGFPWIHRRDRPPLFTTVGETGPLSRPKASLAILILAALPQLCNYKNHIEQPKYRPL